MSRLILPFSLVALLFSVSASTAIEDFTEPVGVYKFSAKVGRNTFTPGLVSEKRFHGPLANIHVAGSTDSVIQISGVSWPWGFLGETPDGVPTHYVEFIPPTQDPPHPAEGLTVDIRFNAGGSIAVKLDMAGVNAFQLTAADGSPIPGLEVCIRPHATLKSIFENSVPMITPFSDKIIILDENGAASRFVYNNFTGKWVDQLFNSADHQIVYPGQGIIFVVGGPVEKELIIGGGNLAHVKTTPTRVSLYGGVTNLIGQVNPLSASTGRLGDLGFENVFVGSADLDDKITVFQNPLGGAAPQYGRLFGRIINTVTFQSANEVPIRYSEAFKVFPINDTHIVLPPGF